MLVKTSTHTSDQSEK